jgi:2-polyprenyl-3-methyl-5-hydroxy-6-metoxy-1,4-benzoquinol methylase
MEMKYQLPDSFESINCPVCGSDDFREVVKLMPKQFLREWMDYVDLGVVRCDQSTPFYYQKCLDCGFVFTNPRLKLEFQEILYNNFKRGRENELGWADVDMSWVFDGSDLSLLHQTFFKWAASEYLLVGLSFFSDRFSKQKNENKRRITLLDYGPGMGHLLDLCKVFGVEAKGIEIDDKRIAYCSSKGLDVMRPEDVPDEKFDIIISTSVLEHIYDLNNYFEFVRSHLSQDGVFIFNGLTPAVIYKEVHTGNFRDASPLHHVNMFTSPSLKKIAKKYGLHPVRNTRMIKAALTKKSMGLHFINYLYHRYVHFGGRSGLFLYIMTK